MILNFIPFLGLIELFQQYGVVIGIILLFFLIGYMIITNSTKRIKQQEEKIDSLYNRIDSLMNKVSPDNKDKIMKFINYAENANKIQIQLYHLLQVFCADRLSIYEFHNGGKNLAGVEFKKCSNTYEAVSLETRPIIKEMQNLPLSINPLWSKILVTRSEIFIPSVDNLVDDFLRNYLKSQSVKGYYSIILQDYDNAPIGFISLEYYNVARELSEKNLDEFNETAIKIAVLINIK